jgi:hypothetical protein
MEETRDKAARLEDAHGQVTSDSCSQKVQLVLRRRGFVADR